MARSKKSEDKPKDSASLQVSIEDFVRTRDSVVTGLANLQSAVQDLSRAYITHTNTVIGKGPGSSLELLNLAVPLGNDVPLFGGQVVNPIINSDPAGESKKRKRAPHDKNAPKRPVTPYFLYMQTARAIIAAEVGEGHSAKEVADEGTKRWNDMPLDEREKWSYKYGVNFARYKEKVKAYKAGKPIPEISDSEAKKLYEEQKKVGIIHEPPHDDLGQSEEHLDSESSNSSSSEDEGSPEPPRAPSPPSPRLSKRRKATKDSSGKKPSLTKQIPVRELEQTPKSTPGQAAKTFENDKKKKVTRKRDVKGSDEVLDSKKEIVVAVASSPQALSQETPAKQKKSKKKRKSEAVGG